MRLFRRASGLLSLPLTAAVAVWAITSGWSAEFFISFFLTAVLPSTVLCITRYRRERELTAGMSWAQAVSLLGLFVFGLTAVENGGESRRGEWPGSHSRWTRLTGWSPDSASASESVARLALGVALLAWLALFVLLILDLRRHLVTGWNTRPDPFPSGPANRRRDLRAKSSAGQRAQIPNRSRRNDEPGARG
ncbi:hypothetical protein [Segniliparus rotundus]|nr:hypothetical protein [Segniliparus rotundus]